MSNKKSPVPHSGETITGFRIEKKYLVGPQGPREESLIIFERGKLGYDRDELILTASAVPGKAAALEAKCPGDAAMMRAAYKTLTNG